MRAIIVDAVTGKPLWRAKECASYCGIAATTWRRYVKDNRAPSAVAYLDCTPLWDPEEVRLWHETRPGSPVPRSPVPGVAVPGVVGPEGDGVGGAWEPGV